MKLNAIRVKFQDHPNPLVLRLHGGSKFSNHIFVSSRLSTEQNQQIESALLYCFQQKQSQNFSEVALHLSDSAGHVWILERTPSRLRILRDGQLLTSEEARTVLVAALLDRDVYESNLPTNLVGSFAFNLNSNNELISNNLLSEQGANTSPQIAMIDEMIAQLRTKLCEELGADHSLQVDQLVQLGQNLSQIHQKLGDTHKNYHEMLSLKSELSKVDPSYLEKLRIEVTIMDELASAAGPLLQPGANPQVIKEKLHLAEQKLSELQSNIGTNLNIRSIQQAPWAQLLLLRAKLFTMEQIAIATELASTQTRSLYEPVFQEYFKIVSGILSSDRQITSELQVSLNIVSEELAQIEPKPVVKEESKFTKAWNRFFTPDKPISLEPEEAQISEAKKCSERVNLIKSAIDTALSRLGELHSELACANEDKDALHNQLVTLSESIKKDLSSARQQWLETSKAWCLPESISIDGLFQLAKNAGQLCKVYQEKEELQQQVFEFKKRQVTIEELVLRWRSHTGSHKDTQLTQPAILIQEAQSIVRYLSEKKDQLQKLDHIREEIKVHAIIKEKTENKIRNLRKDWQSEFGRLRLAINPENKSTWPEFFADCKKLEAFNQIRSRFLATQKYQSIFCEEVQKFPVVILHDNTLNPGTSSHLRLVEQLEKSDIKSIFIIFTKDENLLELMKKSGCGELSQSGHASAANHSAPTTSNNSFSNSFQNKRNINEATQIKTALQEKAQSALEILNGKSKTPTA